MLVVFDLMKGRGRLPTRQAFPVVLFAGRGFWWGGDRGEVPQAASPPAVLVS